MLQAITRPLALRRYYLNGIGLEQEPCRRLPAVGKCQPDGHLSHFHQLHKFYRIFTSRIEANTFEGISISSLT